MDWWITPRGFKDLPVPGGLYELLLPCILHCALWSLAAMSLEPQAFLASSYDTFEARKRLAEDASQPIFHYDICDAAKNYRNCPLTRSPHKRTKGVLMNDMVKFAWNGGIKSTFEASLTSRFRAPWSKFGMFSLCPFDVCFCLGLKPLAPWIRCATAESCPICTASWQTEH